MDAETSQLKLQSAIGEDLKFTKTLTSAVTTAWGVEWDEEFIARDLWQNFFDANRQDLAKVEVRVDGSTVIISAPVPMQLERLFYLGSEKGAEDIGQYGEGFKVAAVCLLRDHDIEPVMQSGNEVFAVRIGMVTVAGSQMHPLVYDFFSTITPYAGTRLILRGCGAKLIKELQTGLSHFFYEGNPLLGEKLWEYDSGKFSLYRSTTGHGHVFYRRLKRGVIPDIPVVLVIDKQYELIEKKTRQDRDRKAFGDELMKLLYGVFARHGLRYSRTGQRAVVEAARACWLQGHPLLSSIAATAYYSSWQPSMCAEVFGNGFYACVHTREAMQALQYETVEKQWQKEGRKPLPAYFKAFGVLNASDHAEEIKRRALEEQKKRHQRPPTTGERGGLDLLSEIIRSLAPNLFATLQQYRAVYSVAETEVLLGELKEHREYRSTQVFLSSQLFVRDFAEALAIFLHEHSHIFGYDGSRALTDALTQLIETVVRHRHDLDPFELRWGEVKATVQRERKDSGATSESAKSEDTLRQMNEAQLRELLKRMPDVTLQRALKNTGDNACF